MSKLPTQLKWKLFVGALKILGYEQLPSSPGSARHFQRGDEDPVTFHEPHGGKTIKQGTLTEYLRKIGIDRDSFMAALTGTVGTVTADADPDGFLRKPLSNGVFISNCLGCFEVVATGVEADVIAAEVSHTCPAVLSKMS